MQEGFKVMKIINKTSQKDRTNFFMCDACKRIYKGKVYTVNPYGHYDDKVCKACYDNFHRVWISRNLFKEVF